MTLESRRLDEAQVSRTHAKPQAPEPLAVRETWEQGGLRGLSPGEELGSRQQDEISPVLGAPENHDLHSLHTGGQGTRESMAPATWTPSQRAQVLDQPSSRFLWGLGISYGVDSPPTRTIFTPAMLSSLWGQRGSELSPKPVTHVQ